MTGDRDEIQVGIDSWIYREGNKLTLFVGGNLVEGAEATDEGMERLKQLAYQLEAEDEQ